MSRTPARRLLLRIGGLASNLDGGLNNQPLLSGISTGCGAVNFDQRNFETAFFFSETGVALLLVQHVRGLFRILSGLRVFPFSQSILSSLWTLDGESDIERR